MMAGGDWLVLRLSPVAGQAPEWVVADTTGALLGERPDSLEQAAAGRRVALVVPAGDVSLFSVALPPANEARLQQLAPFALEEQVSEDLEKLHFAVGARNAASGQVPVAVVARESLVQWQAAASALGLEPRALFAESDLIPSLPGHITVVITREQLLLRHGEGRPVPFPADDPELALTTLLGAGADLSATHVVVHAEPADWLRHEAAFEALRPRLGSLRVQLLAGGLLSLYAQGIGASAPVNLLQGEYRPRGGHEFDWRAWRPAAAALLALLVVHVGGSLFQAHRQRAESARLDAEIERVYSSIFPGQKPGATPRRTLEARMRAVASGGSPQGGIMPLLAALAAARQNVPAANLESLTFKPGSLQLKLSAPDAATLEQFSQSLRAGGYSAQVTSGRQHDSGFEGQIDMSAGS
jgi:general secretion pathway protein L